ncbi:hypothetical protein LTR95_004898 [Oleoguttula sp. CCFEE 5521]
MDNFGDARKTATMYEALPVSHLGKTRVVHLHPARSAAAPLVANLRIAQLTTETLRGAYEALSYTWGNTTRNDALIIMGDGANEEYRLRLTDNLSIALRRLRHPWRTRVIWVDAIFINQGDVAERSQQVSRMRYIYDRAKSVIVWLGDGQGGQGLTEYHLRFGKRLRPELVERSWGDGHSPTFHRFRIFTLMLLGALKRAAPPWHSRAWVYQEHHNARHITWCIGRYQQHHTKHAFAELVRLASELHSTESLLKDFRDTMTQLARPFAAYGESTFDALSGDLAKPQTQHGYRNMALHAHAAIACRMSCKYASDKVYSLMGVLDLKSSFSLKPDYTKPDWCVFAEYLPGVSGSLPSWAFDYADGLFYKYPGSLDKFKLGLGGEIPDARPEISADHRTLYLSGLMVDSIGIAGELGRIDTPLPTTLMSKAVATHRQTDYQYSISEVEMFAAIAAGLTEMALWVIESRDSGADYAVQRPLWPPIEVATSFRSDHEAVIDAEAWQYLELLSDLYEKLRALSPTFVPRITLFVTAGGEWGVTTASFTIDDTIFVVKDCPCPLIVRRCESVYEFRGCAFIPAMLRHSWRAFPDPTMCRIALQ